jgi:hypothetical protein
MGSKDGENMLEKVFVLIVEFNCHFQGALGQDPLGVKTTSTVRSCFNVRQREQNCVAEECQQALHPTIQHVNP